MTTPLFLPGAPVGIFDSGVGGLSVLRHIQAQLPDEHLLYFADTSFAPYGDKPEHVVIERVLGVAAFLVARGVKALVVACNTATVAAVRVLRERYPHMPIVGVEPGLKPGAAATRNGTVGVLATERTLAGDKFLLLRDQIVEASGARFLLQPCVGLADQIEFGESGAPALDAMLEGYIAPLLAQGADTLVLGCTHYPLVQASIERVIERHTCARVALIDTGEAVARQLARLLEAEGLLRIPGGEAARLDGFTTASAAALSAAFAGLLGQDPPVNEVEPGAHLPGSSAPHN
ncbi:glutamate racemase [Massilia yuzhufengensis]|uniref:Glutamate racemase n=1 Tax=Massilia yuzhufengensis TaxID=1164594 RepID=A0A1I1G7X0_9BURK|nr:glutamate racemase [Massilia yuzhufengensis]SFC07809.1 glutamate racemase [Massilia yuzhufengensis]